MINGNVRPGQKMTLLMGASINGVIDKVGADPAVIEQGIALRRSPVTDDGSSLVLCRDQEVQKFALRMFYLLTEGNVRCQIGNSRRLFSRGEGLHALADRF